jgi:outer membrane protein OmpA-like peptidoglycan-associated protein
MHPRFRQIFVLLFLCTCYQTFAQHSLKTESKKAISYYNEGLNYYETKFYPDAEKYLNYAIQTDEKFQNAYLVLAEVYWEQKKYDLAIQYYSLGLSIDPAFYPQGYLNKGKLEIKIGKYEEAVGSFNIYLRLDTTKNKFTDEALKGIKQADFAKYATAHPVAFEPVNLGSNVNTTSDEYWPSLSADEQTLVITRLVHNPNNYNLVQEDFYFSNWTNKGWGIMMDAGFPLNTPDNEGAQSISANGKIMVFTVCNRKGIIGRCDIFYSEKEGEKWSFPKNMGGAINSPSKETQPSLSADGTTIYFASDRPGGKGGLDIWMSSRNEDNTWQLPVNLGDSVNTSGDEMSPFIHSDNNTLYFSSDEHIGMGGFDIFIARRNEKGQWGKIENIGFPINTNGDEIGLIVNASGTTAYYASDIKKEKGKDIFQFTLYKEARPQEVSYLKGTVFDEQTRDRVQAKFELFDLSNGKKVNQSSSDPISGEFLLCIPTNKNYMLNVNKPGYLFYSENFALSGIFHLDKPYLKDIPLKPIKKGEKIILYNIFYETDSYVLKSESQYELDKIVRFLNDNQLVNIEISGHTDNIGSEAYNQSLSENRAKSVVKYITGHGINPSRLTYKGYGFSVPVDTNDTNEGRALNRRTELKIVN